VVFEHDYVKYPELTNNQINEFGFLSPHVQYTEDFFARVVKVHDGDTVTLRTDSRDFDFPLRILGIDAPELSEGGHKSRDWLKSLINGKDVYIVINPYQRVGKYGRLLGEVIFQGLNMGELALAGGHAEVFGSKEDFSVPNVKRWFKNA